MKTASAMLLLLIPLVLGAIAPVRGIAAPNPAIVVDDGGDQGQDCPTIGKSKTRVAVQKGKCIKTASGKKITNTGESTIHVSSDKDGEFSKVDLGDGGTADYEGSGGKFDVEGGGSASINITGNNNTINAKMGANGGSGCTVNVTGSGNTVNNQNNPTTPPGGTTFNSNQTGTSPNTLNLGGEGGNQVTGSWTVNP